MTNTYKGYTLPEILPDEHIYCIISDEGYFEGYSKKAVLERWKIAVDHKLFLKALEDGYIEIREGLLGCPSCGSVVFDVHSHEKIHSS